MSGSIVENESRSLVVNLLARLNPRHELSVVQALELSALHAVDDAPRAEFLLLVERQQLALCALLVSLEVRLNEVLSHNKCCRLAAIEVICLNCHIVDLRTNAESHV